MAKSFTEFERENIIVNLIAECEKSWAILGYKKTNIDELCSKVGISKGAFYLFFESKEALFCNVLDNLQKRLILLIEDTMFNAPNKSDICQMLKQVYLEYDKTNILSQRTSSDFTTFLNKAPQDWKERSQMIGNDFIANTLFSANVELKVEKEKAIGIFNALISILTSKEVIGYDHFEVFCILLDSVIGKIYK